MQDNRPTNGTDYRDDMVGVDLKGVLYVYYKETGEVRNSVTGFLLPPRQRGYIERIVKEQGLEGE